MAVFPTRLYYPLQHEIMYQNHIVNMGDGFEQRVNKNLAHTHADGEGNAPSSHKGINRFTITSKNLIHTNATSSATANALWIFYKARLGSYDPFYFYNPAEASIDLTGVATTGRYLVRFESDGLSRDLFIRNLYSISGISLLEVRA